MWKDTKNKSVDSLCEYMITYFKVEEVSQKCKQTIKRQISAKFLKRYNMYWKESGRSLLKFKKKYCEWLNKVEVFFFSINHLKNQPGLGVQKNRTS